MNLHLRHILALAFILIATIPVLFLGAWVEETALKREMASVSEKHLLLAKNLTSGQWPWPPRPRHVYGWLQQ